MKIRALFMGTPEIAAIILKSLLTAINDETAGVIHDIEIAGVVTQPDKPKAEAMNYRIRRLKRQLLRRDFLFFSQ